MPGGCVALMPGPQGVMPWPTGGPNVSVLVEETRWPIAAGTVDRLIVAHGLETCDRPDALLPEILRVLAPGGAGHLHRAEPLGALGAPRRDALRLRAALQLRPARGPAAARHRLGDRAPRGGALRAAVAPRFWLQTAYFWERIGRRFEPRVVAGALLVEASKQVYARPPPTGSKVAVPGPLDVLEGLARSQARAGRRPRPQRRFAAARRR